MALSGTIYGSFSGISSGNARPYLTWSGTQDIAGNYTDITLNLRFQSFNGYYAFNNANNHTANMNINGDNNGAIANFNLPANGDILVRSRTVRVYHNSDGTKSCWLGADGDPNVGWGTYNFGQNVSLDSIPREAYITTSSINFEIGNSIPINLSNAGNMYVKAQTYVNGTLIKTQNLGQVTSATLTFNSTEIDDMYAEVPNATSVSAYVRITTFSNSGYTNQIGGNRDKSCTASVNQTTNKPTFSTYALSNVDKTINNTDKYSNVLISSSTATLLGSSTKMIKGYSKVRARVTVANKMTALNSATEVKYRLTAGLQQVEQSYSAVADVDLEIDNVDTNAFTVTAFDSRNLTTAVNGALDLLAEYVNISAFGMNLYRDNNIDTPTRLVFQGLIWNKYFSSNTTSNPGSGVLNNLTAAYRWKRSNHAWQALDGTFTITIASPGVVTKNNHGFETGDQVWFTTTGALPTGISINTVYYVIYVNANTFRLATSLANAQAGTAINTSGTQSGTHTLYGDSQWETITPSVDSNGNITFDDYVDGDLGVSGFSSNRSFDIEVRLFDRLTNAIIEKTLSVGIPIMHITKEGISIKETYNYTEGGDFQIYGKDIRKFQVPIGGSVIWNARAINIPSNFMAEDGTAISRTDYSELYDLLVPSLGTFTVTIASPGVITLNSHGLQTGDSFFVTSTGSTPTNLSQNTLYFAIRVDANTFRFASSFANAQAGTAINTSGSQSGTHTLRYCPYGLGNGSTTFNLPNSQGRTPVGLNTSDSDFRALGKTGGAKTHTLTTAETPAHNHPMGNIYNVTKAVDSGAYSSNHLTLTSTGFQNGSLGNTGGGGSHNNLQPFINKIFIIRVI